MADRAFTSEDDFFKTTGLKDFSSVQVLKTGQTPTGQYYRYDTDPTVKQNAAYDPNAARYSEIARQAGQAGVGLDELSKYLGTGLPEGTDDEVRKSLGIDTLESRVFRPAPSTEQLFTDAYAAAGLADVKKRIEALTGEKTKYKNQLQERLLAVNENPWSSEASRLTNIGNTKNFFEGTIGNLTDEELALSDLYDRGLGQVSDLVSRKAADFANQQAIDQAQLNYLLQKADSELKRRESLEAGKIGRYLPEYLQAKMRSTKPETIETDDGAIYQWDTNSGQFVEIRAGTPPPDPSLERRNTPLEGPDLERFGVAAGTTWGEVEDAGLAPRKTLTAEQSKTAGFAKRMEDAVNQTLVNTFKMFEPGGRYAGITGALNYKIESAMPYALQPPELKQHRQAAETFIGAILRKESGAAISDEEFNREYSKYFPKAGEDAKTIEQRKQQINNALASLKAEAQSAASESGLNSDALRREFEGGPTSLKGPASGKTPYLSTLGKITAYGSPVWKPGLDVDVKKGQPVPSPVSGTVIAAKTNGGFGQQVQIRADDGNVIWLSHFDAIKVKPGQKVQKGQVIALGGNSGTVIKGKGGDGSHVDITMPKPKGGYYTAQEVRKYLDNAFV